MNYSAKQPAWIYPQVKTQWKEEIIQEFHLHPVTAQILVSRGFQSLEEIHEFLYAKLPSLHSPFLFTDMENAVRRIFLAINKKERILIFGDNDVDGMTGVALLVDILRSLEAEVIFYLPLREETRQTPLAEALQTAKREGCSLIITVDCGITAAKKIEEASAEKIDVIVTDHHLPTAKLPHCIATLNPKLLHSNYPNRELTGVGVAFKLAHALVESISSSSLHQPNRLKDFLDLVALGTIADMGSLTGENRILVRYGLATLKNTKRIGLLKLFSICDLNIHYLSPTDIASKVAPRLNSLGRIADPKLGVELLLCTEERRAEELAKKLDIYNLERQKIERLAYADIHRLLESNPELLEEKAIILSSDKWHPGVVPILTAKIAKQYNRPTVIIAIEEGIGKGSIRTIREFPLLDALKQTEKYLLNFGGHDYAAGLSIEKKNIESFRKAFLQLTAEKLKEKDLVEKLFLDAQVDFSDLTFDFLESLNLLQPFGNDNPPPILFCEATQTWPPKIVGKSHLKMFFQQNDRALEGIAFNLSHRRQELLQRRTNIKIAFTPYVNVFLNKSSIHLQIKDFQVEKK